MGDPRCKGCRAAQAAYCDACASEVAWAYGKDAVDSEALLRAENARLVQALRHYADGRNWLNRSEFLALPGFHGSAVAKRALHDRGLA